MASKQPSSYYCFICGRKSPVGLKMSFYSTGPGEVMAEYTVPDIYQGYPGVVHGGITAAMMDETAGRAVMSDGAFQFFMTLKLEIKYRQPVPTETPLKIVGRLTSIRGRRATCQGEIRLPDGSVAAEADLLLVRIPESMMEGVDQEALGWRVYDD
jgi:acyl-coenzyme A thioesterase PaaI-like protein